MAAPGFGVVPSPSQGSHRLKRAFLMFPECGSREHGARPLFVRSRPCQHPANWWEPSIHLSHVVAFWLFFCLVRCVLIGASAINLCLQGLGRVTFRGFVKLLGANLLLFPKGVAPCEASCSNFRERNSCIAMFSPKGRALLESKKLCGCWGGRKVIPHLDRHFSHELVDGLGPYEQKWRQGNKHACIFNLSIGTCFLFCLSWRPPNQSTAMFSMRNYWLQAACK